MQKEIKHIFIIILSILVFWNCSETKDVDPGSLGTSFFPLNIGEYRVYKVVGVRYNSITDSIRFEYFIKESVIDTFHNLEAGISYKILREKKEMENDPWQIDSLWTARKDLRTAIMVENNVPFVKLSFPMEDSLTWDGNKLNERVPDEYRFANLNHSFAGEYLNFENSTSVIQQYLPDLIVNWISKKEVYAENIGMVYKENVILKFNQDVIGAEIIDSGIRYYMQLIEYGEE